MSKTSLKTLAVLVAFSFSSLMTYGQAYAQISFPNSESEGYGVGSMSNRQIEAHSICIDITNNNVQTPGLPVRADNRGLFVPTRSDSEWQNFGTAGENGTIPNVIANFVSCTTPPTGCDPAEGASCQATNSCGQIGNGSIQCDGSCDAVAPDDSGCGVCVPNQGQSCNATNSCSQSNSGTIQCDGSCSATPPDESGCPTGCAAGPSLGQTCTSGANACGATSSGTITCDGSCSATTPAAPGPQSCQACNSFGECNSGTTDSCGNGCSATAPVHNVTTSCTNSNSCGATCTGTSVNGGPCDCTAPAEPGPSVCSASNGACGAVAYGTTDPCGNGCSATTPDCPAEPCDACNGCGMCNTGTKNPDGSCSAVAPAEPGVQSCSASNECGSNSGSTDVCGNGCNAVPPPGPSGCDNQCGSTKTADCMGVCGGSATCGGGGGGGGGGCEPDCTTSGCGGSDGCFGTCGDACDIGCGNEYSAECSPPPGEPCEDEEGDAWFSCQCALSGGSEYDCGGGTTCCGTPSSCSCPDGSEFMIDPSQNCSDLCGGGSTNG